MKTNSDGGRLKSDSGAMLAAAVVSRGGVLALQVLVARLLGADDFSIFVSATIVGVLVLVLSDLGFTQAVMFVSRGDVKVCRGLLHTLAPVRSLSLVVSLMVGTLAVSAVVPDANGAQLAGAGLVIGSYAIQSLSRFLRSPLMVEGLVARQAWREGSERVLAVLGGCVGLAFGGIWYVGLGQLAGAIVGAAWSLKVGRGETCRVLLDRSIFAYGITLSAVYLATQLYARLDYLLVVRLESETVAASYAAAYSLVISACLLPLALANAATAHLARNPKDSRKTYLRYVTVTGAVVGAGIALVGPFAVRTVFRMDSPQLALVCVVLGMAFALMAYNSTLGVIAPLIGRERSLLVLVWSAVVVSLGTALILIPALGILGAALSTLITETFVLVGRGCLRPESHGTAATSDKASVPPAVVWSEPGTQRSGSTSACG